jgi:hypothetical protein
MAATKNVLKHVGEIGFLTCFNRFLVSGLEFIRGPTPDLFGALKTLNRKSKQSEVAREVGPAGWKPYSTIAAESRLGVEWLRNLCDPCTLRQAQGAGVITEA